MTLAKTKTKTIWVPQLFCNDGWTPKFSLRFKKCKKSYFVNANCKLFLIYFFLLVFHICIFMRNTGIITSTQILSSAVKS